MRVASWHLPVAICASCILQDQALRLQDGQKTESACDRSLGPVALNQVVLLAQLDTAFTKSKLFQNWFLFAQPHLEGRDVSLVLDTGGDRDVDAYLKSFNSSGIPVHTMHEVKCGGSKNQGSDRRRSLEKSEELSNMKVEDGAEETVEDTADVGPFGTDSYHSMMVRRPLVIQKLLTRGHDVFQLDLDTVWRKSPFDKLEGSHDIYDTYDGPKQKCGCFLYLRPSKKSIKFIDSWIRSIHEDDKGNQAGLNRALTATDADVLTLPKEDFPYGQLVKTEGVKDPTIVHVDYMFGTGAKVNFLKHHRLWKAD